MLSKHELLKNRRYMAMHLTPTEREFQRHLSRKAMRHKAQCRIGFYVADFVFPRRMLIVELDGHSHDNSKKYDQRRDAWLTQLGFTVMRFPNDLVWSRPSQILEAIESCKKVKGYASAMARANIQYEMRRLRIK